MKRSKSIEALVKKSRGAFGDLEQTYSVSLHSKKIGEDLRVEIKNIFENLRSCLDYLAHEVYEHCCPTGNTPKRLYFPIRPSRKEFDKCTDKDFPNLSRVNQLLYEYLESIQPYHDQWLGQFNQLNNSNKHQDLVEQTRTESRSVKVSGPGGGSVSWGPGVTFGGGISVMGVPIDPITQLPIPNDQVKTEVTLWVDFQFRENEQSVLPFVKRSINSVEKICLEIGKRIYVG